MDEQYSDNLKTTLLNQTPLQKKSVLYLSFPFQIAASHLHFNLEGFQL